jgi:TolA-binding protein
MKFSRWLVSGFMLAGVLHAQSEKVMIQELQRDVAQLQNQLRQYKEAQDQKTAELESLLKQSLDANGRLATTLGSLQQSLSAAMAEQQGKLVQPINAVGTKVDQMSGSFTALQTSMDETNRRLARQEEKINEILSNVKTLNAPPASPPPSAGGTASQQGGAAPGASAEVVYQAAYRDFLGGPSKSQIAMDEFVSFIQAFPNSEDGLKAKAQYYIGVIFDRAEQYADSVKAYDAVLERYPENPVTRDALYGKAVALMKLDRNTEAKKEFNAFLSKYSTDDKAAQARQYLKELNGPARPAARGKRK